MGFLFFLFLWPLVVAGGLLAIIFPFIPYIILTHGIIWLGVGLLAKHICNKHQLFKKGSSHPKTWVRVITDIARWAIRIDIVANVILIAGAIILAAIFIAKGITPILFG